MNHHKRTAKARVSEWEHHKTRTKIGLYVNGSSGEWYAYVPDTDRGELVRGDTREALVRALRPVADRVLGLEWRGVIRVRLNPPSRLLSVPHSMVRIQDHRETGWDPTDPSTAGCEIALDFEPLEVATDAEGRRWQREWLRPSLPLDWVRRVREDGWERVPGVLEELPYTPENLAALESFRDLLSGLSHQIRTFCASDDFASRLLLAAPRIPMLTDGGKS